VRSGNDSLYIISPIDFVPDFTPLAGQVDDVGVGVGGFGLAFLIFKRYHEKRMEMEFLKTQRVEEPEILMEKLVREQGYRIARVDKDDESGSRTARTINFRQTSQEVLWMFRARRTTHKYGVK